MSSWIALSGNTLCVPQIGAAVVVVLMFGLQTDSGGHLLRPPSPRNIKRAREVGEEDEDGGGQRQRESVPGRAPDA